MVMHGHAGVEEAAREGNAEAVRALLPRASTSESCRAVHAAVHRNAPSSLAELITAGAPIVTESENLLPLTKALHLGHLRCACVLINGNAPLPLPPPSLIHPRQRLACNGALCCEGGVVAYGEGGGNYALGLPRALSGSCTSPSKLDALEHSNITDVFAAKFHSAALTASGQLYTWGLASGGRLGQQHMAGVASAVIEPVHPIAGKLGSVRIVSVSLGKHHSLACDASGNVWAWGSNLYGQLGFGSNAVDTQPTPKRVTGLKAYTVTSVSSGSKHSGAVTSSSTALTWGCNKSAQLGHGVEASGFSGQPRQIENIRDSVQRLCLGKHHTLVLRSDGRVLQVGNSFVTPRKVGIKPSLPEMAGAGSNRPALSMHRVSQNYAVDIATGAVESFAVMDNGRVVVWLSTDPQLRAAPVEGLGHVRACSISSGKKRSVVVAGDGSVYEWNHVHFSMKQQLQQLGNSSTPTRGPRHSSNTAGHVLGQSPSGSSGNTAYNVLSSSPSVPGTSPKHAEEWIRGNSGVSSAPSGGGELPVHTAARAKVVRVSGLQKAVSVAAGEKHCLAVVQHWRPDRGEEDVSPTRNSERAECSHMEDDLFQLEGDADANQQHRRNIQKSQYDRTMSPQVKNPGRRRKVESLKAKCEREAGKSVRDERTATEAIEVADALGALSLRRLCARIIGLNLDGMVASSSNAQMLARLDHRLLAVVERHLQIPTLPSAPHVTGDSVVPCSPEGMSLQVPNDVDNLPESPPMEHPFPLQQHEGQQRSKNKNKRNRSGKKPRKGCQESQSGSSYTIQTGKEKDEQPKMSASVCTEHGDPQFTTAKSDESTKQWEHADAKPSRKKKGSKKHRNRDERDAQPLAPPSMSTEEQLPQRASNLTTLLRGGVPAANFPAEESRSNSIYQQASQRESWQRPSDTQTGTPCSIAEIQQEQASARNAQRASGYAAAVAGSPDTPVPPSPESSSSERQHATSPPARTAWSSEAQMIPRAQSSTQPQSQSQHNESSSTATAVPLAHLLKQQQQQQNRSGKKPHAKPNVWDIGTFASPGQSEWQQQSTSPPHTSLREIQEQQAKWKQQRQASPIQHHVGSPWAMPPGESTEKAAQSLTHAQAEERAMQELRARGYDSVRIRGKSR